MSVIKIASFGYEIFVVLSRTQSRPIYNTYCCYWIVPLRHIRH